MYSFNFCFKGTMLYKIFMFFDYDVVLNETAGKKSKCMQIIQGLTLYKEFIVKISFNVL